MFHLTIGFYRNINLFSSEYPQQTFCELPDSFFSVREPFWPGTFEVPYFLVYSSLSAYVSSFCLVTLAPMNEIFSANSFPVVRGLFFTILTNFEQARRFAFFGAPVLGLLLTLPCFFHFLLWIAERLNA